MRRVIAPLTALALCAGSALLLAIGTPSWTALSASGPSARFHHASAYDAAGDRLIVFGGARRADGAALNDVWVLAHASGATGTPVWQQLAAPGGPDARFGAVAEYDPGTNTLMIFGGAAANAFGGEDPKRNDVWVLSNANGLGGVPAWTKLAPVGGPPAARIHGHVGYDQTNNRLILFGGQTGFCGNVTNDTWALSFANGHGGIPAWTNLAPAGTPPVARRAASAVYDPAANRLLVFGGQSSSCFGQLGDLGVLENANGFGGVPAWSAFAAGPGRTDHAAAIDPVAHEMFVFGGHDGSLRNDTWKLSGTNLPAGQQAWTQILPSGPLPPARAGHTAAYNAAHGKLIVFGGDNADATVWTLSAGAPARPSTAIGVSGTATYGGAATLRAVLTSNGTPVSGRAIAFLLNGVPVGSTTTDANGAAELAGASIGGRSAGTYPGLVSASFAGDATFEGSSASGNLDVSRAAPTILWTPPAAIAYGTPIGPAQLNAQAVFNGAGVSGGYTYSPPSGTVLNAGVHLLTVVFTPGDGANFLSVKSAVALTVNKANQTIGVRQLAATGSMQEKRSNFQIAKLSGGRVLAQGGALEPGFSATAEIYDPSAGSFTYTTGAMPSARAGARIVALDDNDALIVAGGVHGNYYNEVLRYDGDTGTFALVANMAQARAGCTVTRLIDGRVLITGGAAGPYGPYLKTADIFDPQTNTLTPAGTMAFARNGHTATRLADGRVLITGGNNETTFWSSAEIFDPATGRFTATGSMPWARTLHEAVALKDGRVLVTGGYLGGYHSTAAVFNPASGTFTALPNMTAARAMHSMTLLPNGDVFIAGNPASAELYRNGTFMPVGPLLNPREMHGAVMLDTGNVLIAGGAGGGAAWRTAEIYYPTSRTAGDPDFPLFAASSAGLPVTFSASGPCQIVNGNMLRVTAAGTCNVTASQAGGPNHNAAPDVVTAYTIEPPRQSAQTIAFDAPGPKAYGNPDFAIAATASSGLPVSFAASGACTLSGDIVHLVSAGVCMLTASQAGNDQFLPAPDVTHAVAVAPAALTIRADDKPMEAGGSLPPFTATFIGFAPGDTPASLNGTLTFSTPANSLSPVGMYPINASGVSSPNYDITFAPGVLTVRDTVAPVVSILGPGPDQIVAASLAPVTARVIDAGGVTQVIVNGIAATLVAGSNRDGTWQAMAPVALPVSPGGSLVFRANAIDRGGNTQQAVTIVDNDGLASSIDMAPAAYSNDFSFAPFATGTVMTRGGWIVLAAPDGNRVRVQAQGAGGGIAEVATCPTSGAERVELDAAGETAAVSCQGQTTMVTALNAVSRGGPGRLYVRDSSGRVRVPLLTGQAMTIGSPVTADPSNTEPMNVELLGPDDSVVGTFALDPGESAEASVVEQYGVSVVSVRMIVGTATVIVGGESVTLGPGESSPKLTLARGGITLLAADLAAMRAHVPQGDAKRIDEALRRLNTALAPALWDGGSRLDSAAGEQVFQALSNSAAVVQQMRGSALNGVIDRMVRVARQLATVAIEASGSDAGLVERLKADGMRDAGKPVPAIEQYRNSWTRAVRVELP